MQIKEKAINLIDDFGNKENAIKCVDEIINLIYEYWYDSYNGQFEYWNKIKEELIKL
jgi:hypothetical protein